jgi:uncharacterized protein YbgA (DUF1722 family)
VDDGRRWIVQLAGILRDQNLLSETDAVTFSRLAEQAFLLLHIPGLVTESSSSKQRLRLANYILSPETEIETIDKIAEFERSLTQRAKGLTKKVEQHGRALYEIVLQIAKYAELEEREVEDFPLSGIVIVWPFDYLSRSLKPIKLTEEQERCNPELVQILHGWREGEQHNSLQSLAIKHYIDLFGEVSLPKRQNLEMYLKAYTKRLQDRTWDSLAYLAVADDSFIELILERLRRKHT